MTKQVSNNQILLTGLQNTEYFYWQVRAVDNAGNKSDWAGGELFKMYVDDVEAPTFTSKVNGTFIWSYAEGATNPDKIMLPTLTWNFATDDRAGVSQYIIEYRQIGATTWTEAIVYHDDDRVYTWNDPNGSSPLVLANGNYEWQIRASDYVGTISTPVKGEQTGYWYGDFTAPVFQTSKVVSATTWDDAKGNIKVTQSWEAAVDNAGGSGVCRYELKYRDAGSAAAWKTITVSAKNISWTGNVANGDYDYTLSAFDAGGNQSSIKSGVWLGDLNGPAFASETAVAENKYDVATKKSTVKFSWTAATDKSVDGRPVSGLSHYVLSYRGPDGKTNTITVKSGTSYTLPSSVTLEEGTYSWTVTAYDKAGNSTALTGNSFYIDTGAPTGKFNYLNTPVITVEWNEGATTTTTDEETGETTDVVVVRSIHSAKVKFTWSDTYSDPSGVVYTIQFSDSKNFSGKNTYSMLTYQENGSSFSIGNGMPTIPVGIFENMDTVYWRVMAQDTLGNTTGIWSPTQSFKFIDPVTNTKVTSSVKPQKPYDISVTQTKNENGVYDGLLKYDWYVKSSELGIAEVDYVFASKDGGDNFQFTLGYGSIRPEDPTDDTIGFSHIHGYLYNPNRSGYSLADGAYTWNIVTRDTKGRTTKSDKYSFILDTTAPTTVTGIGVTSLVRDALVYWNASTDRYGIEGYQLQYRLKGTSTWHIANTTLTTDTNYWFTDLSNGVYEMVVYAIDKNGNRSASSGIKEFSLSSKDDLPDYLEAAKSFETYAKGGIITNTIGMSDVYDCFYFDAPKSGNLTLSVRGLQSVYGKGGAITIEVFRENPSTYSYELVKKYSYKKVGFNQLLLNMPAGQKYYVAISNRKGDAISKYDLAMTYEKFDSNNENDYWQTLPSKYVIANHGTNTGLDNWIGYGDLIDYFKVNTASGPGTYNVNLSGLSGKVKLTLYQTSVKNGVTKLKKMKSITVSPKRDKLGNVTGATAGALLNQLVGDPDVTYYIAVEAPSGKKGVNSNYKLNFDSTQLFTRANQANDNNWATAPKLSCQPGSKITGEWVGFGDKIDYRKLSVGVAGAFDFIISGIQNSLKMTIFVKNGDKLKKLKSVTVSASKGVAEISNLLLQKGGDYYISIEAPKAAKGVNSDYNVNISGQLFNNPNNSKLNNFWDDAGIETIGLGNGIKGEWVGYGDACDWFKFDIGTAGGYNFDFRLDVEKAAKMTVYSYDSITGALKKVKLDSFGNADLASGKYAVEIVSADKGKGKKNTGYDLGIAMQAVSNSDPLFSSSAKIDDWENASRKQGMLA